MTESRDPVFHTTQWTVVLQAQGEGKTEVAESALEDLCRRYWYPLYAFARRSGYGAEESEDLTQAFFARLLEKQWLDAADRERGKFRTFLMMAMKRFLANEWNRERRLKRGGGAKHLSFDADLAEEWFAAEPVSGGGEDPVRLFDRRWAMTLLDRTMARLQKEESEPRFSVLKESLVSTRGEFDCAGAAESLGISEGATRVAVHRFRKRYRELFRDEIAQTIGEGDSVDEEIRYLVEILSRG